MAQLQTFPPQPGNKVPQNIRNDNFLLIPDGGLRLVNGQNRTIGAIVDQGGNGGIVFMNSSNRPSVQILAGNAGQVFVDGGNGPSLRMLDPASKELISLNTLQGRPTIKLKDTLDLVADTDGGRILIKSPQNTNSLRLDNTSDGGRITGFDRSQATLFSLENKNGEGIFTLKDKEGSPGFQAAGTGTASVTKDKEVIWKVPTDK